MKRQLVMTTALLCLATAACGRNSGTSEQAPIPSAAPMTSASGSVEPVPNATINEIMRLQSEPAADAIWNSVKTVSNASGVHEFRPRTDAEWAVIDRSARILMAVAEFVVQPARRLVRPGVEMEAGGTLSAEAIQARIAANRRLFAEKARALDGAAREALAAAQARDAERLLAVGGPIDEACEGCHVEFYYPEPEEK